MAEGLADVGSPFDSALSDDQHPMRNTMNSSRAASSQSDLDARKVSWVSTSGERCFLKAEWTLCCSSRPMTLKLEPGVYQLGDFTGGFLPRDGRTGLKLITKQGRSKHFCIGQVGGRG